MAKSQRFSSKKSCFSCPVSLHVAWSWGLIFQDCPVVPSERDSDECRTCSLRGDISDILRKEKAKPKKDTYDRNKSRAGKPSDGTVPNKGKTYIG